MKPLERTLTKLMNATEPELIPTTGQVEMEQLYLTRWDAIEAMERDFERIRAEGRRPYHLGCE